MAIAKVDSMGWNRRGFLRGLENDE